MKSSGAEAAPLQKCARGLAGLGLVVMVVTMVVVISQSWSQSKVFIVIERVEREDRGWRFQGRVVNQSRLPLSLIGDGGSDGGSVCGWVQFHPRRESVSFWGKGMTLKPGKSYPFYAYKSEDFRESMPFRVWTIVDSPPPTSGFWNFLERMLPSKAAKAWCRAKVEWEPGRIVSEWTTLDQWKGKTLAPPESP